jgi:hypothetical protein
MLEVENWHGTWLAEIQTVEKDGVALVRTFFDAVLLVPLELLGVFVLVGYALDALLVVVFVACALRGSGAFW